MITLTYGFGVAVGLAVQAIAKDKNRLLITSATLTSDFTSKFCSNTTMQWNFNTVALANSTARAAVQRGLKNWFFLTADYAFGHALERDASVKLLNELWEVNSPYIRPCI